MKLSTLQFPGTSSGLEKTQTGLLRTEQSNSECMYSAVRQNEGSPLFC